jgi:hypothetical protein
VWADALPLGTVIWSNPGNGSGVYTIVPAVPSPDGVADVFAFQYDGTVQAITSEGATAWTADVGLAWGGLADFQGGLLVAEWDGETSSLVRINGATGQRTVLYSMVYDEMNGYPYIGAVGVHTDGTIFLVRYTDEWHGAAAVVGIDPDTGAQKFTSPVWQASGDITGAGGIGAGGIIVAGDGYAYVPYAYQVAAEAMGQPCQKHLKLLRMDSSGARGDMVLKEWTDRCGDTLEVPVAMITNADTGILLSWDIGFWPGTDVHEMAVTAGTAVTPIGAPGVQDQVAFGPEVQTQDGWLVGQAVDVSDNPYLIAIDAGGALHWAVSGLYQPKMATADGGVIATAEDGTPVIFDQTGSVTGVMASLPVQSWTGNTYQTGSVQQVLTNWINLATSFWPSSGGNVSGTGTATLPAAEAVRQLIAQIAAGYVGSQNWVNRVPAVQCNQFVKQVLQDAGTQAPLSLSSRFKLSFPRVAHYLTLSSTLYPASAGDWAYPHNTMKCWRNVPAPTDQLGPVYPADLARSGDVIAEAIYYSDATGHVGVVVGPDQTASADSAAWCVSGRTVPNETITVSDFGFRPDGWVDPYQDLDGTPCRTHGLKSQAVVKRFVCQ